MARRDPLRELSRRFPPADEAKDIIAALSKQDERATAIVGASVLEALLERLIVSHLEPISPGLKGRLFKNRGPLSDFRFENTDCPRAFPYS